MPPLYAYLVHHRGQMFGEVGWGPAYATLHWI
jgi:hypothetical protein